MKKIAILAMLAAATGLAGCGGGASGSISSTPTPIVTLEISQAKVSLGSSTALTWSAENATSCSASGAWGGIQPTSGTSLQTPLASGSMTYTLTCTNSGGATSKSVTLTVPIPVLKSSYENKVTAAAALGPQKLPKEVDVGNAVAFADFFQNGSYSMVTHTLEYDPSIPATANKLGHIRFYKSVGGAWVDNTSALLTNTTGCLHPRKAIVADFNGDRVPDVYFACHGFDAPPFSGEQPRILLSQVDGKYKNVTLPVTCFCHGASAADFNGDGYADILVTNNSVAPNVPFFLINNKDGTFATDTSRLPSGVPGVPFNGNTYPGSIFTVELIDFDGVGKYDAFLAGTEPPSGNWLPTIFKNDGSNHFTGTKKVLPSIVSFVTTLDIVFSNGAIYLNRVADCGCASVYGFSSIQKIDYKSMQVKQIYANTTRFANEQTWLNWIIPYQGSIASLNAMYGVMIPE